MRNAAFERVRVLTQLRSHFTHADLVDGFQFNGERVPLTNPQRGIFKPRQMRYLLSIKTVFPRSGAAVWYDDQRDVHRQIYEGSEDIEYAFMGTDPDSADNRWLREAHENRVPIIYFLGVAPGIYQALCPVFISGWSANALRARVVFGRQDLERLSAPALQMMPEVRDERRYTLTQAKHRLHQSAFREAVIAAYGGKCAISGLPEPMLLDAAHIIPDRDEQLGHPIIPNGVPLSKLHHAAFDGHLIGIDPDLCLHVSDRLLRQHDGPMLAALQDVKGKLLRLPARSADRPDRERLELRFKQFLEAG